MARKKPTPPATVPARRVLLGRLVVDEDPLFQFYLNPPPALLRGIHCDGDPFLVYAELADRTITIISRSKPPRRVSLSAIVEAMMSAKPRPRRRTR